jgi:hypothetical protein
VRIDGGLVPAAARAFLNLADSKRTWEFVTL